MSTIHSKQARARHIRQWHKTMTKLERQIDALAALLPGAQFGNAGLIEAINDMQAQYTTAVMDLIDDQHDWLTWYWLDNDMGAKGLGAKAGHGQKYKRVKTVNDLIRLIEFTGSDT